MLGATMDLDLQLNETLIPLMEFAALVSVRSWTLRRLFHSGKLRGVKVRRNIYIPLSEAEKFRVRLTRTEDMREVWPDIHLSMPPLPSDDKARKHRVLNGQTWVL